MFDRLQGLSIFLWRPFLPKGALAIGKDDCERRPELVRGIGRELRHAVTGLVHLSKGIIEHHRQTA